MSELPPGFGLVRAFELRFSRPDFGVLNFNAFQCDRNPAVMRSFEAGMIKRTAYSRINKVNLLSASVSVSKSQVKAPQDLAVNSYAQQMNDLKMLFSSSAEKEIKRISRLLESNRGKQFLISALHCGRQFQPDTVRFLLNNQRVPSLALKTYIIDCDVLMQFPAEVLASSMRMHLKELVQGKSSQQIVSLLKSAPDSDAFWLFIQNSGILADEGVWREFSERFYEFDQRCDKFYEIGRWLQGLRAMQQDEQKEEEIEGDF